MLLNCDLGESYGERLVGMDELVMPHIDQANIACGFHGGDPLTIRNTIALAARHAVAIGAHPSYPDLQGFGRRSVPMSAAELIAGMHYQLGALDAMALCQGLQLAHVKPHGALYNDMMRRDGIRAAVMQAVASYPRALTLVLQASERAGEHRREAQRLGLALQFEAFADRRYLVDGSLMPRDTAGAVLNAEEMLAQIERLRRDGAIIAADGSVLQVQADTLCVHGDNAAGVGAIQAVRKLLTGA